MTNLIFKYSGGPDMALDPKLEQLVNDHGGMNCGAGTDLDEDVRDWDVEFDSMDKAEEFQAVARELVEQHGRKWVDAEMR